MLYIRIINQTELPYDAIKLLQILGLAEVTYGDIDNAIPQVDKMTKDHTITHFLLVPGTKKKLYEGFISCPSYIIMTFYGPGGDVSQDALCAVIKKLTAHAIHQHK